VGGDFCGNLLKPQKALLPAVPADSYSEWLSAKPEVRFAMTVHCFASYDGYSQYHNLK
jgi:hypothetical protein